MTGLCSLMAENPPKNNLKWHANFVVRREMTKDVFKDMKKAGGASVTFGIESGFAESFRFNE